MVRKFLSGHEKRQKNKRVEQLILSQRGALDKFFIKEPQVGEQTGNSENLDGTHVEGENNEQQENANFFVNDDVTVNEDVNREFNQSAENVPQNNVHINSTVIDDVNRESFLFDIYDPRRWDGLDSSQIDILALNGPKRDLTIIKGPKDKYSRRFSSSFYTRTLSNGETCDRDWLVYSKEVDKVFCFSCKLFKKGFGKGQLVNEGFSDWTHLSTRLREHETSVDHVLSMATWGELRHRLQQNQTIDSLLKRDLTKKNNTGKM